MTAERRHVVACRLSAAELARLDADRRAAGYRWRGAYVRRRLLDTAPPRGVVPDANLDRYARLGELAADVRRLLRHLEAGHLLDAATAATLGTALGATRAELAEHRAALLGLALGSDEGVA